MNLELHKSAPLYEALSSYSRRDIVHFDVPGHKKQGSRHLVEAYGEHILKMDANSTKELDLLGKPTGVIMETERLIADAWGADNAFMLVNGSTSGVQYMIMAACRQGDKIIMPRNVHKSAINGLILAGAVPVFVTPETDEEFGVVHGVSVGAIEAAIRENPDARAVFVINPTYFGATSNLRAIVELAHRNNMAVLVDEAHGAHFPFHDSLPVSAMQAGADLSTASVHKTCGSLTQSSILLHKNGLVKRHIVRSTINLFQTTSASYLLMSSLDLARRELALNGNQTYDALLKLIAGARQDIGRIPGLSVLSRRHKNGGGIFDYDETKIVVNVRELGLTGFEAYDLLMSDYAVQCELAEIYTVLCVCGTGDTAESIRRLINALQSLSARFYGKRPAVGVSMADYFETPELLLPPREAFYRPSRLVSIDDAEGEISGESIMIYPPGIPLVIPGERITGRTIGHYKLYLSEHCVAVNDEDSPGLIKVVDKK